MGKVSKNSRVGRGKDGDGGKNYIKVVVTEKSPETGAYIYKTKMIHKDKVKEYLKDNK